MAEEVFHGGGGGGAAKVSLSGANTAGVLTLISTGTMYMAGGNNITISQNGNSLTFVGMDNVGATTFRGGVSTVGNTSGATGTINNQIVFAGGNNVTLSQSINGQSATVTISVPNTHAVQTGISSISVSDTVYTSGQVVITGAGAVTVSSGANQSIIINAPVQSVQPEGTVYFGVSSGGNTVGSTGMASGTGPRLVFVGGNNITLSQSLDAGSVSGTITISAGASGAGGIAASLSGNSTSGGAGYSLVSTGTLYLAGGNNITLSQDSNSVTISGANIGGAQTGISGISGSNTVYTSGTVEFVGSNIVTVRSSAGQQLVIDASVAAQTAESNSFGMSNLGNTSGTSGIVSGAQVRYYFAGGNNVTLSQSINGASGTLTVSAGNPGIKASLSGNTSGTKTVISSGTMYLAGGNNITLSQDGQSITISGAEGGGAGISTLGNTAGTTGIAGDQVILVGSNNITLSQSIDAGSSNATISIIGAAGAAFAAGVSSGGNTSGDTKTVGSQVVFAGGSNITLSQATNGGSATITIIGGAGAGSLSVGNSDIGNTSGETGVRSDRLVLAGINNITLSGATNASGMTMTISGPTGGGAGMGAGTNTSGTSGSVGRQLYFYDGANISLSQSVNGSSASLSIIGGAGGAGYTAGFSTNGNTSGDTGLVTGRLVLAGGNNVTLSGSTNGGSMTVTISAANAGGAQTGISSIINSQTTYTSGAVSFLGSNIVTVKSGTGQALYFDATVPAQTAETAISGIIASNTTYTSGTVSFVGSGIVTVESGTGQQVIINASAAGGGFTAGMSDIGNTSGTTGLVPSQIVFVGGNNVTLSQSINASSATLTISGPNTVAQTVQTYNVVSASGNTSGTLTSFTSGTIVFAGGNNITLSQSSNTITISGPTGGGAGMGTGTNTSGTSGSVGKQLYFYGNSNIGLSQSVDGSSASLTIIGNAGAGGIAASLSGNSTSGGGGYSLVSTGTLYLAGGNNITLSQDGRSVTISGANLGGAQTGISAIADGGGNSITVGTVQFSNANNVSFGFNSVTMTASFSQTVQPEGVDTIGMSNLGNTAGTSGVVNGSNLQYYFAGGNNITLSQSINGSSATLTISGANVGGAQTGISGLGANGTTFTSGTVVFSDFNNVSFGTSGAGAQQTITASASYPAQTNQQMTFYATSNTILSSSGTINASSIILKGNDKLSVGVSNGSLIFEAGGADAGSQTIGMSDIGNTSGTTGVVSASAIRYLLAGGNNVTLSQSLNGASGTVTISVVSVPSTSSYAANVSNVSSAGTKSSYYALVDHAHIGVAGINASGTASTFVGNVMLSGTNLTLVTGGNSSAGSIGLSVAAQSVQTQGSVQVNGSTGALSFNAGANMSLSTVASNLTFINLLSTSSYAANVSNVSSAGTRSSVFAMVDHAHIGVAGVVPNATASTFVGNVNLSAGANISLASGGNSSAGSLQIINLLSTSGSAADIGTASNAGTGSSLFAMYDHVHRGVGGIAAQGIASTFVGSVVISAGNNITLSTGGNSTAGSIAIHGGAGGAAGTQTLGMSNLGNSGGTSGVATGSNVQFVFAGSNNITLSQSINGSSGTISIYGGAGGGGAAVGMGATGNTAGNTFSSTTGTVWIQGTNNITVSGSTAAGSLNTIWVSGPTGGGAGMGTGTNTSGTSGSVGKQLYIYGNSNITLSQSMDANSSSASLTIIAGAGGGFQAGISGGNTAGDTGSVTGRLLFAGGNNITVSGSTNAGSMTVTISGPNLTASQSVGMSNLGNTSGTSGIASGQNVGFYLAGGANITLSQSLNGANATITISGGAAGGATVSEWMPPGVGYSSFTQMGQSSLALFQVSPPYYVTASRADMWASISLSTSSNSSHDGRISLYMGVYTRNASTLSLASSGSQSHSWNVTGSTSSGSVAGWRDLTLPIDVNLTPGHYWVGVLSATATTNANWFTASNMGLIAVPAGYSGPLGATNATNQMQLGNGIYSAQTAALPASIAFSQINASGASTARPIVNFVNLTI